MNGLIVYDLEYTSWEGSWERGWSRPGEHREIVQIGAVRLGPHLEERAAFEALVRPRVNPNLSDYFVRLTGITRERVAVEGIDLIQALARLAAFSGRLPLWANGGDGDIIADNCRLIGIDNPLAGRCHSIRPALAAALGPGAVLTSGLLPATIGFPSPGSAHNGLADARAIAEAMRRLGL